MIYFPNSCSVKISFSVDALKNHFKALKPPDLETKEKVSFVESLNIGTMFKTSFSEKLTQ